MNQRKSTFKVSPQKRPVTQRLTPLAWVFIAIAALVVLASCTAGALTLTERPTDEPWDPTATATTAPTEAPAAPAGPSPTPRVWYEDIVTPTVTATDEVTSSGQLPWWSDQMTQDDEGNWWPPEEVAAMVEEQSDECGEAYDEYLIETTPPDIQGYKEVVVPMCYPPERTEEMLGYADYIRDGVNTITDADWNSCHRQVQDWSEDGMECTLGVTCSDGTIYEYDHTGQLISTETQEQGGLALTRWRYDPTDGRWKQLGLIEYIPPQ
jgi:hypothetical protein